MLAVFAGAVIAVVLLALPADAHAVLQSSDPAPDAILARAGASVTLRFDQGVSLLPNGIRVVASDGSRVDRGDARHVGDDRTVRVGLRSGLPRGTYLVSWRVVSADSHPVGAAFTYSIGTPGQRPAAADQGSDGLVGLLFGLTRLGTFAVLAVLVGGATFVLLCWPEGRARPQVRRLLRGSVAGGAGAAVAGLLLQGTYAAGLPLVHLLDGRLLTTVAGSSYGHALLARLGLFAATMAWLAVFRRGSRVLAAFTGAPLALALLATLPLAGHPDAGSHRALALLVDTVHVAAMSTWVGGLAVLAGLLVRTHRDVDLPPVVARFSRQAAISLLVLVGSGIVAAVREVGSPSALYSTDYGIILFLKINLVIVVVGVAAVSRGWIRRRTRRKIGAAELTLLGTGKPQDWSSPGTGITHVPVERRELVLAGGPVLSMAAVSSPRVRSSASPSDSPTLRRRQAELEALRHSVVAELVIALVILGVTAVLVATVPAKTAYRPTTSTTVSTGPMVLRVSALPAGPRQVTLHVTARDRSGIAIPDAAVNAALLLPQEGFSLLPLRLEDLGQGRFLAEDVRVPVAGQWHLRLAVRTSDLQVYQAETPLQIH